MCKEQRHICFLLHNKAPYLHWKAKKAAGITDVVPISQKERKQLTRFLKGSGRVEFSDPSELSEDSPLHRICRAKGIKALLHLPQGSQNP